MLAHYGLESRDHEPWAPLQRTRPVELELGKTPIGGDTDTDGV